MANRVTVPVTNFETLNPPWSLQSLDQDLLALQAALNDASLGYVTTGTDTGTANNYVITTPAYGMPSAYNQGMTIFLVPANTNSGASTLTVGALGSAPITDASGNPLASGALVANQGVWMTYTGTSFAVASIFTSQIYSVRLRSFSSVGNPNFEVDQRQCGTTTSPTNGAFVLDRWAAIKNGTMVMSAQQTSIGVTPIVPGTSFYISSRSLLLTLTTQQTSLAAGDFLGIQQNVEGANYREIAGDVSSISLLISTSVSPLKFAVALRDSPTTKSLVKLCTISSPGYTLIQLPNIPAIPSGNFSLNPGSIGYTLTICFACGTTLTAPSLDVWNAGNFIGAPGMDNFAGKPITSSTINIGFVQHEPGPVCTTLIDKPFAQNYDECLRYFQKTYAYGTVQGTVTGAGLRTIIAPSVLAQAWGPISFFKPMAKVPTVNVFNPSTGTVNSVRDTGGVDHVSATPLSTGETGFFGVSFTTSVTSAMGVQLHYIADTGW